MSDASLGSRTARGMAWAYGSYVGGRLLVLVSTAVLARLLTPGDFGVVALAVTFMTFLDTVKDLGLGQALIGTGQEDAAERTQTVFVWTVVIGATLMVLAAAASPLVAAFFDERELLALVPALAVNLFVQALGATHDALARKALDYKTRTIADIADVVTRGVVGIVLALLGAGVWALVVGYLVGSVARVLVLWAKVRWRPERRFSGTHLRDLATFGGKLTLLDVGSALSANMDYLFVGRVLGATSLGLYTIGYRLPELIILNLAIVAGDVLFPSYAELGGARLREGFLVSLRYIALLTCIAAAFLVVLADPIVALVFGPQWQPSVEVMQVLALGAVCSTLNIPAGVIYKVTRRAGILLLGTVPFLVGLAVLLLVATPHGILWVAAAVLTAQAVYTAVMLTVAGRVLEVHVAQLGGTLAAPVGIGLGTAAAMLPAERLIGPPLPALLVGGACGGLAAAGLAWWLARDVVLGLARRIAPGRVVSPGP